MLERGYYYKLNINSRLKIIKEYNRMWDQVANWPQMRTNH